MKIELPDELFSEEELKNTPDRYKRFMEEWGKTKDRLKFTTFPNPGFDQIIIIKDINFFSLCSHHLLPFVGKAHIGYIPTDKICGLSKVPRVVDIFAHKPQLQERLTQNIADYLENKLKPKGLIVVIEAEHYCISMRGVNKPGHKTITSAVKGVFLKEPEGKHPKEEFFRLLDV